MPGNEKTRSFLVFSGGTEKWVNNINLDTMVSHRLKVMEDTDRFTMLGKEKKQMD